MAVVYWSRGRESWTARTERAGWVPGRGATSTRWEVPVSCPQRIGSVGNVVIRDPRLSTMNSPAPLVTEGICTVVFFTWEALQWYYIFRFTFLVFPFIFPTMGLQHLLRLGSSSSLGLWAAVIAVYYVWRALLPRKVWIIWILYLGLSCLFASPYVSSGEHSVGVRTAGMQNVGRRSLPEMTPVRSRIVRPGVVGWTWRAARGMSYRVASWRYIGAQPVDVRTFDLGSSTGYSRAVQPHAVFYLQLTTMDAAGREEAQTNPVAAPSTRSASFLVAPRGELGKNGFASWHWSASDAVVYRVASWAYAGRHVVDRQHRLTAGLKYSRHLLANLRYYISVQARGNDGLWTRPMIASRGLVRKPAHSMLARS